MNADTWLDFMVKDIEEKSKKDNPDETTVKLSESDMNTLADIMIKKMSETDFDIEKPEEDEKDTSKPKPDATGEIPID